MLLPRDVAINIRLRFPTRLLTRMQFLNLSLLKTVSKSIALGLDLKPHVRHPPYSGKSKLPGLPPPRNRNYNSQGLPGRGAPTRIGQGCVTLSVLARAVTCFLCCEVRRGWWLEETPAQETALRRRKLRYGAGRLQPSMRGTWG